VLRVDGFRVVVLFPPREHGPAHVHVLNADGVAVIYLVSLDIKQFTERVEGMKRSDARAAAAHYDTVRRRVVVELMNGYAFEIPIEKLPEIAAAPAAALALVEILGAGNVLHWESLDADYSIPALVLRAVGETYAAREFARLGGRSRSRQKVAAARANGKRGGRPRLKGRGTKKKGTPARRKR